MGSLVREETKAQKGNLLLEKSRLKPTQKTNFILSSVIYFFLLWLENIERKNLLKYTEKKLLRNKTDKTLTISQETVDDTHLYLWPYLPWREGSIAGDSCRPESEDCNSCPSFLSRSLTFEEANKIYVMHVLEWVNTNLYTINIKQSQRKFFLNLRNIFFELMNIVYSKQS